jgi:hypothetical protein
MEKKYRYYGYYGFDDRGRTILYIPNNLIGIGYGDDISFDWDPDTLQGISLLFSKELIWEEDFIKKGWDICKVEIPKHLTEEFQSVCLGAEKRKDNRLEELVKEKARGLLDYASNLADYESSLKKAIKKKKSSD